MNTSARYLSWMIRYLLQVDYTSIPHDTGGRTCFNFAGDKPSALWVLSFPKKQSHKYDNYRDFRYPFKVSIIDLFEVLRTYGFDVVPATNSDPADSSISYKVRYQGTVRGYIEL